MPSSTKFPRTYLQKINKQRMSSKKNCPRIRGSKPKRYTFCSKPLGPERKLLEAGHHVQHEVAQRHFPVLLLHNPEQSDQRNYDTHEACQCKAALLMYRSHTLF